jgi:hypothetical protein
MTPPLSSQRLLTMPFAIPAYWTPEQALAVVGLLDDLRPLISAHYGKQVIDEAREKHRPGSDSRADNTAVDIINTLAAAQSAGRLKREFKRYLKPTLLIVDELGYLPIDKHGADLLFQLVSQRYERAPVVITTNRAYKYWAPIFNNDSTLTSAILDRLLHHVDTVVIEAKASAPTMRLTCK